MYCVYHSVYCIELFIPCQPRLFIFFKIFYRFDLLFSSNAVWIVTHFNSFFIAVWATFVCHPRFKEYRLFIFAWFIITIRTLNANHSSLLGYIYNALAWHWVDTKGKKSPPKWAWLFLLRGISCPRRCLDCQCGFRCAAELYAHTVDSYFTFSRCFCIYFFCIYGRESPTLRLLPCRAVHLLTLCPVETMTGPA